MHMKSLFLLLAITLGTPLSALADDTLWIKQTAHGMDCAPCAYSVEKALAQLAGVSAVEVSLENGIATLSLTAGAQPDMAQIREIIKRSGFTPRAADVRLEGRLTTANAEHQLVVGGQRFTLEPTEAVPADRLDDVLDTRLIITGRIPEDKATRIEVKSILLAGTALAETTHYLIQVEGLSCELCAENVERRLQEVEGVIADSIDVNVDTGEVRLNAEAGTELSDEQLQTLFEKAGFTYRGKTVESADFEG